MIGKNQKPKVGVVLAFTGYCPSVRIIARFLELAGVEVVKSQKTTPDILEEGVTLANSDFCLPLRVYVGHVKRLCEKHPDLTALLTVNIRREMADSSACAKHRDIGGVALRSLDSTIGYLCRHTGATKAVRIKTCLERLVKKPELIDKWQSGFKLPRLIMPSVNSLSFLPMRRLCFAIYADIFQWPRRYLLLSNLPPNLRPAALKNIAHLQAAFAQAYHEVLAERGRHLHQLLADETKPRLGLVGRNYMVMDPALTADIKPWFEKRGVVVLTPGDVPLAELPREKVAGYYDTHKEGQAFIDWAAGKVDGFICLGSFGCHPDAFQIDFLAAYARSKGLPCWTFRYDETTGAAGFATRYETILSFLLKHRESRLKSPGDRDRSRDRDRDRDRDRYGGRDRSRGKSREAGEEARPGPKAAGTGWISSVRAGNGSPDGGFLITWPYMGDTLNLALEEAAYQLGLADHVVPPAPITGDTILLGNERYTESCSPYACSTGSLKETIDRLLHDLEAKAAGPTTIVMLMLRGEGPCTFGWYSLAQSRHLPEDFAGRLEKGGHRLIMATMGMSGISHFIEEISWPASRRLKFLLNMARCWKKGFGTLSLSRRLWWGTRFLLLAVYLTNHIFFKMRAAEKLRAAALRVRAHEIQPGEVTQIYKAAIEELCHAHSRFRQWLALRRGLARIHGVKQDGQSKPRVISVGEIYVVLTSFANRGTVETIMAQEGIEVEEGISLSAFVYHSMQEIRRRALRHLLRPILDRLEKYHISLLNERLREPGAKPFLLHEVGGEGVPTVAAARRAVERGCDGILHLHPFKCMPEGIAKDALKEMAALYGVPYLALSFDKELDIERLRTETATFAALLRAAGPADGSRKKSECRRRQQIGRLVDALYHLYRRPRYCN